MIGPRGVGKRHIPERNSAVDGRWLIATRIERIHLIVRLIDDLEDALRGGESILLRVEVNSDAPRSAKRSQCSANDNNPLKIESLAFSAFSNLSCTNCGKFSPSFISTAQLSRLKERTDVCFSRDATCV